jgi:aminoglycoside phosphotransferase (APT) family kinase protein
MPNDTPTEVLPAGLADWVASVIGRPLVRAQELTGGASRTSYVVEDADDRKHFLRVDTGKGPLSGTPFTLEREFGILSYLQGRGLPIARVDAYSAAHDTILMEHVTGHTSYQKTGSEQEEGVLRRELMAAIVDLQKLDTAPMKFLGDYSGEPLGTAIPADLAVWKELYSARVATRDPLIEFSFNWLERALREPGRRAVLVHGDVGPGNFMIEDGHVRALIDWELVRVGHPFEDLACIIARALGAPFGPAAEHIANYEQLAGTRVDRAELDYALALILTRWMIGISMGLSRPSAQQNVPMLMAFRQLNGRALVDAFARRYGIRVPEPEGSPPDSGACATIFAYAPDSLRALAAGGRVAPADTYKLQGVVDLIDHLKGFVDYGAERYEREYLERVSKLVGRVPASAAAANVALCDHARSVPVDDARPLVELLSWWYAREHSIMRKSLGERAGRTIDL